MVVGNCRTFQTSTQQNKYCKYQSMFVQIPYISFFLQSLTKYLRLFCFGIASVHHKWNVARLFSLEVERAIYLTSCPMT